MFSVTIGGFSLLGKFCENSFVSGTRSTPFLSLMKVFLMLIETANGDSLMEKFKLDFLTHLSSCSQISDGSILMFNSV